MTNILACSLARSCKRCGRGLLDHGGGKAGMTQTATATRDDQPSAMIASRAAEAGAASKRPIGQGLGIGQPAQGLAGTARAAAGEDGKAQGAANGHTGKAYEELLPCEDV